MPLYLILAAGTPMLACLTERKPAPRSRQRALNAVCVFAIGMALFLVSALRYHVGNDYNWYTEIMHEASVYGHVPTEEGFNILVRAVYALSGFENYLLVFALFSFATVFFFLDAFCRYSDCFALSFTMFILLGYYYQSFSTVRYYAVLPLSLYALRLCERRDWPRFLLVVCAGALFHKSILAVLVFYPVACIRWKKYMIVPAALLCGALTALPSFWTKVAVRFYPTYQNVAFDRGTLSIPNVLRCVLVIVFVWTLAREDLLRGADDVSSGREDETVRHMRVWTKLSVMGLVFYVCAWFLPQISRIAYYLTLPQLLLVPAVVSRTGDTKKRRLATAAVIVCCVLYFVRYMMQAGNDGILVLPYRTFLFR